MTKSGEYIYKNYKTNYTSTTPKSIFISLFSIIIILIPFLWQYSSFINGLTLGDLLLVLSVIPVTLLNSGNFKINKIGSTILVFWFAIILTTSLNLILQGFISFDIITRFTRFTFYLFIVAFYMKYFKYKKALTIYMKLAILISIYLVIQYISFYLLKIQLPNKILSIPYYTGDQTTDIIFNSSTVFYRPAGIFKEPGYLVFFIFPALIISLFNLKKLTIANFIQIVLFVFVMIFSSSTQGLILVFFILMYRLIYIKKGKTNNIYQFFGLVVIGLIIFLVLSSNIELIQYSFNKIFSSDIRPGSSTALRIYRGFAIYKELPLINKLFGVGHGNLGNFVISNSIYTQYDALPLTLAKAEFINGIMTPFIYYGIFVGFYFVLLLISSVVKLKGHDRLILISIIILLFSDSFF